MNTAFQIVHDLLLKLSGLTGFTYNEVNIIAYYLILPFAYVALADKILKIHVLKILYAFTLLSCLLAIKDFRKFSDWLFNASVDFLLAFQVIGWNYVVSSVLICVVFPGIVFLVMFHFAYPRFFPAILRHTTRRNPA